ncbi:MAG TPA: hypothetical protein VN872_07715 [Candidatus Acidoferrum sp.]|nr:hypothetical protein [Candidatus Acidoferrum sp.]
MKAELSPAIDFLHRQLEEKLREANEIKKLINSLLKQSGETPEFSDILEAGEQLSFLGASRPDQYYGKPFATAAEEYLLRRKQACPAEEIMRGLEQGGFDFKWDAENRFKNTAISLGKNVQKFHKLPNGTYGLRSWYPNVADRDTSSGQ